ncbi:MAG: pitrilysin family protein [Chloroflexota bacterium]|nr:pitrilysin family protein [Chloroflexota bacterium]
MDRISFEKTTLPNGLDVILHQDTSLPVVSVNVWYHVGSKEEQPGRTGFAHLFEHLMFEGTKHHNSSHFGPLQEIGASLNGSTTTDRTNYWENVPSNYLELALWLESDRMGFLLEALDQKRFDIQRDVVKNERRQSYENRPYGIASLELQEAIYARPHPYHWPVIGYMEDLDAASLEDCHAFYRQYYGPANASLAIAGDFEYEDVRHLVEKYFGGLKGGHAVQVAQPLDAPLVAEVDRTLYDNVNSSRCYLVWPGVSRFHPDEAALDVLCDILSDGRSSRMHQTLVYDKQIAQGVNIRSGTAELAGDIQFDATVMSGHTTEETVSAGLAVIQGLQKQPPTEEEVARIKNRIEWGHVRSLANVGGFGGIANQLNSFNIYAGDPDRLNTDIERYLAVQPEDVQRVANQYLSNPRVKFTVMPTSERSSTPKATSGVDRTVQPIGGLPRKFTPPMLQSRRLPNGLEVTVVEKRGVPAVSLALHVATGGASDPTGLPGLANITADMLQEGTKNRTSNQISEEFEFIGTRLAIYAGREQTTLAVSTLTREWPKALNLVGDLLMQPVFPDDELERVKNETINGLRRLQDDATSIANREMAMLLYGVDSDYGHPIYGTENSVGNISRDDLLAHYQNNFNPASTTLTVAGDVSLEEAVQIAEATFGSWNGTSQLVSMSHGSSQTEANIAPDKTMIYLLDKPGSVQSVIRAGILGLPRDDPDYFALIVFDHLFGGQFTARLNMNLRQDKGYSYGYRSWIEWHKHSSAIMVGGSVQTEVTTPAVVETLKEITEVVTSRLIEQGEFQAAQEALLQSYPLSFETPWQVVGHLGPIVQFGLPHDYLATYPANINNVKLEDVQRVANQRLGKNRLAILVVGDRATIEADLKGIGPDVVVITGIE